MTHLNFEDIFHAPQPVYLPGSPMLALEPGASGPALKRLAAELPRPKAIVLVSAHWESPDLRIASHPSPQTWHDFGGFPPALFAVQYPAPGDPALAAHIAALLEDNGLPARLDARRPFDHGAWVPLSLMYPEADIPVVQVSLPSQLGPTGQSKVGHALAALLAACCHRPWPESLVHPGCSAAARVRARIAGLSSFCAVRVSSQKGLSSRPSK